jgi:hypothetical protein
MLSLALKILLLALNAVYPDPHQGHWPYFQPITVYEDALVGTHETRWDIPHLWTRGAQWELGVSQAYGDYEHNTLAPGVISEVLSGNILKLERRARFYIYWQDVQAIRTAFPCQPMTGGDMQAVQRCLAARHKQMFIVPDVTDSYAWVSNGNLFVPHTPWTTSGWPPRIVVLHEMTHVFQQNDYPGRYWYCNNDTGVGTPELAAMIVETCEAIREGLTADQMEWLDTSAYPIKYVTNYYTFTPAMPPRVPGRLAYDYCVRYGPHLTGDVAKDLVVIEQWVKEFEPLGVFIPKFMAHANPQWRAVWDQEVQLGMVSPLTAACQEWLATQDCASAFLGVFRDHHDGPAVPSTIRPALIARLGVTAQADPDMLKALDFLAHVCP